MGVERIVAVGLLTERERDVLGASLKCVYPVSDAVGFEHLLRALDELDPRTDPPRPSPGSGGIRGLFR